MPEALRVPFRPEVSLALKDEVSEYLAGRRVLGPTQLDCLRDIMQRYIDARAETIALLRAHVPGLQTREDFAVWFRLARMHDFDPTEQATS